MNIEHETSKKLIVYFHYTTNMLVTLIHHPETLELKYFPCDEWEVLELDEELVNKVKECSTDRVQEVLKSIIWDN